MHDFAELVDQSARFILKALEETETRVFEELQTSASTHLVKTLQMIRLQKAIMAVGMFSIFESTLQDQLACCDGFAKLREILKRENYDVQLKRFSQFANAINVLKHGRGRSYDTLLTEVDDLPFRLRRPDEAFFSEGDVSEVSTLIEVNDQFVQGCADIIRETFALIRTV